MLYHSPLHTISSEIISIAALKLERKKKLAEVDLSPTKTLVIYGKSYTKDDLIRLFDRLMEHEEEFEFHRIVFQDKSLLVFLEQARFEGVITYPLNKSLYEDPLLSFISPYYKESFLHIWEWAWKKKDLPVLTTLLKTAPILNEEDVVGVEGAVTHSLHRFWQRTKSIEQQLEQTKKIDLLILEPYLQGGYAKILNLLPDTYTTLIDRVVGAINNLGVDVLEQNQDPKIAYDLFSHLKLVYCRPDLEDLIQGNFEIAQERYKKTPKKISLWGKVKRVFYVIFAIYFILTIIALFIAPDDSSTSSSRYSSLGIDMWFDEPLEEEIYPTEYYYDSVFFNVITALAADTIPDFTDAKELYPKTGDVLYTELFGRENYRHLTHDRTEAARALKKKFNPTYTEEQINYLVPFYGEDSSKQLPKAGQFDLINNSDLNALVFMRQAIKNGKHLNVAAPISVHYIKAGDSLNFSIAYEAIDYRIYLGRNLYKTKVQPSHQENNQAIKKFNTLEVGQVLYQFKDQNTGLLGGICTGLRNHQTPMRVEIGKDTLAPEPPSQQPEYNYYQNIMQGFY